MENCLVAALLKDPKGVLDIEGVIAPSDFQVDANRNIYNTVREMVADGEVVDVAILSERKGLDLSYMGRLMQGVGAPGNMVLYAESLRESIQKQEAAVVLQQAIERLEGGSPEEVLSWVQSEIATVERHNGNQLDSCGVIKSALDRMDLASQQRDSGGVNGAPWALDELNQFMGGISGPRLIILAARPGCGKTAISQQSAICAADAGFGVGILSLEIDAAELGCRWISHVGRVNISGITRGVEKFFDPAVKASHKINGLPLYVDDDTYSLDGVCSRITRWRNEGKIDLAIVDHIGLVEYSSEIKSRNDGLGVVSRRLKKLTKQLDMPIIALSQLNRAGESTGRRPQLSDLRDSGNIEQDADAAVFLNKTKDSNIEIGVLKNRMGATGWSESLFSFDGAHQTFEPMRSYYGTGHA